MIPLLGPLVSFITGGGLTGIAKTFFGDKAARESNFHNEQMSINDGYQAEFNAPEKQGWFNQLVDGANRLVRPFFTYGIIVLFIWAAVDPVRFVETVQALAVIPELLWYIMLTIVAFWFGGRILEKAPGKISGAEIKVMAEQATQIQKQRDENTWEDKYSQELADTSKTLSNKAILEWNKRNNKNFIPGG
jgi:hypothetical protein